jgi:small subunit ribosomal protein S21
MKPLGNKIQVHDGNWEKALRKLKKKVTESGLLQEVKDRQEFVKPTVKRKIAKNQAVRRWKKQLSSQQLPPRLF